jgi:Nuclease-related domain/AAA domain
MLPRDCPGDTPSVAERRLFKRIESELSDDWTAMHSVGIARHQRKPWAEADFVLIGPGGVYVLEVKGGAVRRINREWTTNGQPLKQSPIDQAAGAAAALYSDLGGQFLGIRSAVIGHGVCFPDVRFAITGVEVEAALIYDADDGDHGFDRYVARIVKHWRSRLIAIKGGAPRPLSPKDVDEVVRLIAPDFNLVRSLRAEAASVIRELVLLTDEQVRHFQAFEENPRVVVRGSAGTGKTLLAAADAERTAAQGSSVLFVCQSNALRDEVRSRLGDQPKIQVFAFQELCGHLMRLGGIDDARVPGSRSQEYFDVLRPTAAMEGWAALDDPPQWDLLVVDEAQDLLTGPAAELLELLVDGGWDEGRWRLFLDPVQDLFAASHTEVVDRVSAAAFRVRLSVNCRNSAPIARDTAIATGGPLSDTLAVQGPEPTWLVYSDEREHVKLVGRQIREWIDQGLRPQDITILSPVRRINSVLSDGLPAGTPCSLIDGPLFDRSTHPKAVQFSTIAAFKGLESDAVLLLDAPYLGRLDLAASVYVGMTRARAVLSVLRESRYDGAWRTLQREFGKRLVTG